MASCTGPAAARQWGPAVQVRRGWRRPAALLPGPDGLRTDWRSAGHQRRARRARHRDSAPPCPVLAIRRSRDALRGQPDGCLPRVSPSCGCGLHSVYDQLDRVLDALTDSWPRVPQHLESARANVLAVIDLPKEVWRQIWSDSPSKVRSRRPAGAPTSSTFPRPRLVIHLAGAALVQQHGNWARAAATLGSTSSPVAACARSRTPTPARSDHPDHSGARRLTRHEDQAVVVTHRASGLAPRRVGAADHAAQSLSRLKAESEADPCDCLPTDRTGMGPDRTGMGRERAKETPNGRVGSVAAGPRTHHG